MDQTPLSPLGIYQRAYRFVTSLSYDIVGSTPLMGKLGNEKYAFLLDDIHPAFALIVKKHGGFSALAQGSDGCMCYFGANETSEHAKSSALLAALEMQKMALDERWVIRIGLAYGLVAINKNQPIGLTVHLADRLQGAAAIGAVLVSESLAEATRTKYEYVVHPLSAPLDGFPEITTAYELVSVSRLTSTRFDSESTKGYLYGRQQLLGHLHANWQKAKIGNGSIIAIDGEAGIGKSALIQTLACQAKDDSAEALIFNAYPEHQNQAFAPLVGLLESWQSKDLNKDLAWAISTILGTNSINPPFLSNDDLMSQEGRVIAQLVVQFQTMARSKPMLVVFEDYQWLDSATARLFDQLITLLPAIPMLLIASTRISSANNKMPAQVASKPVSLLTKLAQQAPPYFQRHQLEHLSFEEAAALIEGQRGACPIDALQAASLITKCAGVPLFLHEGIRLLQLQAEQMKGQRINYQIKIAKSGNVNEILKSRLDAVGAGRLVAHIASAIGSSFELDILVHTVQKYAPEYELEWVLAQIEELIQHGIFQAPSELKDHHDYSFNHALMQDIAYESMWESDRIKIHATIADLLIEERAEEVRINPHWLGRQLNLACRYAEALPYLLKAGQLNRRKGSHAVAIYNFEECLSVLESLEQGTERQKWELEARVLLAGQVLLTQGYGDSRVGHNFTQALSISAELQDTAVAFKARLGLNSFFLMRGHFEQAEQEIHQARRNPRYTEHPINQLLCDFSQAMLYFYRGQIIECQSWMERCDTQSGQLQQVKHLTHSPDVLSSMYRAYCLWMQGKTELASAVAEEGIEKTDLLIMRLAKIQALGIRAMLFYGRGEWQKAFSSAQQAILIGQEGEYALWLDLAHFMAGAATVQLACIAEKSHDERLLGIAQMQSAYASWVNKEATLTQTFYLCTLAQCCLLIDRYEESQTYLNKAVDLIEQSGERYFETEVYRTLAQLFMQRQPTLDSLNKAQSLLDTAYQDATSRGLFGMALRLALTMHEWEQVSHQKATWLAAGITTNALLTQSMAAVEAHASSQDAMRCRRLLIQQENSIVQKEISCLPK